MEEKELAAGVSLLNCLGLLLLMRLWSGQVKSQLREFHQQNSLFLVWDLMVTPGSWLSSTCPSSSQVQRPFGFLTPNLISVFQFTSISLCVLLCSKTISVSGVGSGANSHLTHPLSIQALFEKRHHTSELPFCWYFHICLEGIYVHIAVEEHWNWASSSLYLKNRKILLCIFSPALTPNFDFACFSPLFSAVILGILFPTKPLTEMVPQDLFFSLCSERLSSCIISSQMEGVGERWVLHELRILELKDFFVPLCSSLRVFDLGCAMHCFGGWLLNWV